jgi:hypothetical protein
MFVVAGTAKLGNVRGLVRGLDDYQLLPTRLVSAVGHLLIAFELAVGLGLLVGLPSAWMGSASVLLGVSFMFAIGVNLSRGRRPACQCFGGEEPISRLSLLRSALLTVCAAAVAVGGAIGWEEPVPGLRDLLVSGSPTPVWEAAIGLFFLVLARWLLALPDLGLALYADRGLKGG